MLPGVRSTRQLGAVLGLGLALGWSAPALANGRFPSASQVALDPTDGGHIVLRTTYGVLQTTDGGAAWHWICEQAVGYGGVEDPAIGVTAGGTILAGIFEGLAQSHDRGCSWELVGGVLAGQFVVDVAVEPGQPSHAVAITSTGQNGKFHVVLAETKDDAKTWAAVGVPIPDDFLALTVEVAPSDPNRVYVSGLYGASYLPGISRSDDRGATWTRLGMSGTAAPYIGAVDPGDPDRLYVRVDGGDAGDVLYVSDDGAASFQKVLDFAPDKLLGFALSPDGKQVAVGGPDSGVHIASSAALTFSKKNALVIRCLRWEKAGLYACADEFQDGFTLGLSHDDGASFDAVYHLPDLAPLECAAGTPYEATCPAQWPATAANIGVTGSGGAGAGGGGGGGAAVTPPAASASDDSGCATSPGARRWGPWALLAAAFASVLAARRRRLRAR